MRPLPPLATRRSPPGTPTSPNLRSNSVRNLSTSTPNPLVNPIFPPDHTGTLGRAPSAASTFATCQPASTSRTTLPPKTNTSPCFNPLIKFSSTVPSLRRRSITSTDP